MTMSKNGFNGENLEYFSLLTIHLRRAFSVYGLTSEYTDQYITHPKIHSFVKFTFLINELSINLRSCSFQYTRSVYRQYTCKAWPDTGKSRCSWNVQGQPASTPLEPIKHPVDDHPGD